MTKGPAYSFLLWRALTRMLVLCSLLLASPAGLEGASILVMQALHAYRFAAAQCEAAGCFDTAGDTPGSQQLPSECRRAANYQAPSTIGRGKDLS